MSSSSSLLWTPAVLSVVFATLYWSSIRRKSGTDRFPSPPSDFLVGHYNALKQNFPWLTLSEWRTRFGDIFQLHVIGQPILILNSAEDAHNLLEKRSGNYSDRPRNILQGDIVGAKYFTAAAPYGDEFRTLRRFTSQYFNSRNHSSIYPLVQKHTRLLLKSLLDSPQKYETHFGRLTASTIVKATYGFEIQEKDDPFVKLVEESNELLLSLGVFGLSSVDLFPFLRVVFWWLPMWGMVKKAKKARILVDRMLNEPYEHTKSQRSIGCGGTSLVDSLLADYESSGIIDERQEFLIKNAAAQIYAAGVETMSDVLITFMFEMIHHPEVAKKAQEEIDRVLGKNQLPTLMDRADLPYIDCILKEVMRVNPAAPLGVPHANVHQDVYKGKTITKGSIVISNIWAMMHDEQCFPNPDVFDPDRYLTMVTNDNAFVHHLNTFRPDDPAALVFGFGRRICPGRFLADAVTWLVIANILTVFDIRPVINPESGKEVLPELSWIYGGLVAQLKPFDVQVIPRSEKHAELVSQY